VLDRWIQSSLANLTEQVTKAMDGYDLQRAVRPFVRFIEDLTNWYIRRSRRRFWKSRDDEDKAQAYRTLYDVLVRLSKIAAPFIPFISESLYRNLRTEGMPESVHLCDFPSAEGRPRDPELEKQMDEVMSVVRVGRLLRTENDLKVRQPLSVMHVVSRDAEALGRVRQLQDIVLDELNVKELRYGDHETELVVFRAKPDFSRLGPRFGPRMKAVAGAIGALGENALETLALGKTIEMDIGDEAVELEAADVVMERIPREGLVVATEGALIVALETELTEELVCEGLAREFVNKVQNMRKAAGLEVTQRIGICCSGDAELRNALEKHGDYVRGETLCLDISVSDTDPADSTRWDINGHPCAVHISART
jgi:isoleucyl-tRNA synthetase